jgi:hypothetical protein
VGVGDLRALAGDVVPPHQHGLGERDTADQQRPRGAGGPQPQFVAGGAEVAEVTGLQDPVAERQRAVEHDERVLEVRMELDGGVAGTQVEVDADVRCVAARRRSGAVVLADEHRRDAVVELDLWERGVVLERRMAVPRR